MSNCENLYMFLINCVLNINKQFFRTPYTSIQKKNSLDKRANSLEAIKQDLISFRKEYMKYVWKSLTSLAQSMNLNEERLYKTEVL